MNFRFALSVSFFTGARERNTHQRIVRLIYIALVLADFMVLIWAKNTKEEVKQMDREEFMTVVYELLKDDPDNNRANEIINAADEYAESMRPKHGKWILNRSGVYCCSECMEPCATYVMMKPRDKFCKMCGARMER